MHFLETARCWHWGTLWYQSCFVVTTVVTSWHFTCNFTRYLQVQALCNLSGLQVMLPLSHQGSSGDLPFLSPQSPWDGSCHLLDLFRSIWTRRTQSLLILGDAERSSPAARCSQHASVKLYKWLLKAAKECVRQIVRGKKANQKQNNNSTLFNLMVQSFMPKIRHVFAVSNQRGLATKSDILFMGFYKQGLPREIILALWNPAFLHVTFPAAPAFFLPPSFISVFG